MTVVADRDLWFTMSVVDEFDATAAAVAHVRRAYPGATIVLVVDTRDADLRRQWRDLEGVDNVIDADEQLYAVANGGRVVGALLEPFLEGDARWWLKIDPDTFVRRPFEELPEQPCFFGTLQGGKPMPSLQGGCIGGTRSGAERLVGSGVLSSPELANYAATWAEGNPVLLSRAEQRGMVSFDFVHAWACDRAGVPLVGHPEIRSQWASPPAGGSRFAVTHPHKDLTADRAPADDEPETPLAARLRSLLGILLPAGSVVAVVSHGDDELLELGSLEGWHFPRHERGYHAGEHPADSARAIAHLEHLRAQGARYLAIPEPSLWWLDHYVGLRRHLEHAARRVTHQPDICALYELRPDGFHDLQSPAYWDASHRAADEQAGFDDAEYARDRAGLHEAVAALVPGAARVLDLGCGSGLLGRRIKAERRAMAVVGVDFSPFVVERAAARDRELGIEYRCLDIRHELASLEGGYDVVTLCEVLEYLEDPRRAVADAAAQLRPGGRLVLACARDDAIAQSALARRWSHDDLAELLDPLGGEIVLPPLGEHRSRWLLAYTDIGGPPAEGQALGPQVLDVSGPNLRTLEFVRGTTCRHIAEIGIYRGYTSQGLAEFLAGEGELHLFDFADVVGDVAARLADLGHTNVVAHGNSRRTLDSYNWSLMRLLERHREPLFDYVYLDGAHTWGVDALAFLLVDRLLKVGGYVDLDDYDWTLSGSATMNPDALPAVRELFTDEQIQTPQVALLTELLVRRDARYEEIVPEKIFRKVAP